MKGARIDVTEPYLPPLEEFIPYLQQIWESKRLTNSGPLHLQLEMELAEFLGVDHIALLANGTTALLIAFEALQLSGEVITTPYSFVATTHALRWKNLTPVFVDIDPDSLTIDPKKIEAAITPRTSAILAVHVYGQPCDVAAVQRIADTHHIKLIYDAAHSFAVQDQGGSILRHGDLSILSFHATKVFTTFEGGAVVCRDAEMKHRIDSLKNFGLGGMDAAFDAGINGKMSEIHAAFGLVQLQHVRKAINLRKRIDNRYRQQLGGIPGIKLFSLTAGITQNYSYFPILIQESYGTSRDELYYLLSDQQIFARSYFSPLISNCASYRILPSARKNNLPIANFCEDQVLCLPLSPSLTDEDVDRIVAVIRK